MYFFKDKERVAGLCKAAVEQGIVLEAKHSDAPDGVSCFYLECDDVESHKKVIQFFLDNDMIQKTKAGKLYNISFKLMTKQGLESTEKCSKVKLNWNNFLTCIQESGSRGVKEWSEFINHSQIFCR